MLQMLNDVQSSLAKPNKLKELFLSHSKAATFYLAANNAYKRFVNSTSLIVDLSLEKRSQIFADDIPVFYTLMPVFNDLTYNNAYNNGLIKRCFDCDFTMTKIFLLQNFSCCSSSNARNKTRHEFVTDGHAWIVLIYSIKH
ncbi:hypothetical protein L596_020713 [Steinernema carpocapsae]|uniref:Uncharacterized protein n=1 Tax=Steinernema carpocapsae TaxID=34508 RepID=A0A4U5MUC9_STECR|nr:hypothetical protein L596_020713 [Steinernema carpocapsae]